ncbi:MAG: putative CRISPR-associated protein [Armatimonadetes bacterium]|nr:putative CRISPR-associated protein [Armatimonadota bacterium]MDW8028170.1 putative CRISPR-associated protein [Armatimonadota bacterium]
MRTILVTVGTSLLTNAAKALCKKVEELNDAEIANYLRTANPEEASAETNSLSRLLQSEDRIVFLHSDTEEGERCARLLENHYEHQGYEVETERIPDLNYKESRFKMRGLRSLVSTLINRIQKEWDQGREVLINATGGFKAEIAYAVLVGLLFDLPVAYIHERFRDIIEMPPVPIAWDYSLLADHEDFFDWIEKDLRTSAEVEERLKGRPAELRMLLAEEDEYIILSPAGEAFYQAFKRRMAEVESVQVSLSSKAWESYKQMDEQEQNQVDKYLRRLKLPEWRRSNSEQPENSDCLVAPRGHINLRLIYYEQSANELHVVEILRHNKYERIFRNGVFRNRYTGFKPFEWRSEQR